MNKNIIKKILVGLIIIFLLFTNIFSVIYFYNSQNKDEEKIISSCGDEISRVRYFILDWFDELKTEYGPVRVYRNELQFNNGDYPLTVAANRIRCVYPRGERYFQLEYITYIEFFEDNGSVLCRLYFLETGKFVFKLTK